MDIEQFERIAREDPKLARQLLELLAAQKEAETERPYIASLHPKQKAFVLDRSPKKTALCSRRAGKSEGLAAWLLEGAESCPGGMSVYIVLSRNHARGIMWRTLEEIERRHSLGLQFRERDNQLFVRTKNRHDIWLAGCKDSVEVEKFRGLKYRRAAIDEAASFGGYIRTLVDDVLEPALLDLQGELALTGTPGAIPAGLFYEATTGDKTANQKAVKWPTHHWTVLDNPYVPHAGEWLAKKLEQNNWSEDHPTYLREWKGIWVRDDGALVYPFDERNLYHELPSDDYEGKWRFGLGIDVGHDDPCALVVVAYRQGLPELYVVHVEKHEGLIPSQLAAKVARLQKDYKFDHMVIDSGGLGKGYQEEMSRRYNIHAEPAKKTQKRAFIEVIRGEMMSGNVRLHPVAAGPLIDEMAVLTWDERREAEDGRFDNHCCDAFLYVAREVLSGYTPVTVHAPLTPEQHINFIAARHKAMAEARVKKQVAKLQKKGWKAIIDRIANRRYY